MSYGGHGNFGLTWALGCPSNGPTCEDIAQRETRRKHPPCTAALLTGGLNCGTSKRSSPFAFPSRLDAGPQDLGRLARTSMAKNLPAQQLRVQTIGDWKNSSESW